MPPALNSGKQLPGGTPHCRTTIAVGKRHEQAGELQFFLPIAKMGEQEISDFKRALDIALDIKVVMQVRFGQPNFCSGQKHSTESIGMF
jgi:hypothetical protein